MKNKLIILLLIIITSCLTYFIVFKSKQTNHISSTGNSILSDDAATSSKTIEMYPTTPKETSSVEKNTSNSAKSYTAIPKKVENNEGNNLSNSSTNVNNSSNSKIDASSSTSTTINHSDISNNLNQTKKTITISSFLSNLNSINYVLKSKETLTDIARKYENTCNLNTSIKIIKSINNISDGDNVDEGRTLLIPESTLQSGSMYPVVTGDTWYSIAQKYYSSYDVNSITTLLIYINDLPNNDLPLGESIFLPKI